MEKRRYSSNALLRVFERPSRVALLVVLVATANVSLFAQQLDERLSAEDPQALATEARSQGDARRGAIIFYQPHITCTQCHGIEGETKPLGPDLTQPDEAVTGAHLVESILNPSKVIKKGYESINLITSDGRTVSGLLVDDRPNELVLRDVAQEGKLLTIPKDEVDERADGGRSIMPDALVNQLGSRQQFLDLVRYVMEIVEGGPSRAKALRPPPSLFATRAIAQYERDIDHAGMIAELDEQSFERGEAIYNRLCVNCHGGHWRVGSLPTSLRFATGKFKNGSDPYRMYRTLTRGFGMMAAQTWMVPSQKYDVIHYIREAYLKKPNPTQYARVDQKYLQSLPEGTGRGPEPTDVEPWVTMDYGPNLNATYEFGNDGSNFAYKGIAVRLDGGAGGVSRGRYWMVYDHDTLRVAGAYSGERFIDFNGINFNGRHEIHPRVVGDVHFANPIGPGWARPGDGSFDEVRLRGRDGRAYGPLPREWAKYRGLYHFGNRVLLSYTVGDVEVLEMPGLQHESPSPVFSRTFHIGSRADEMTLQVAHLPNVDSRLKTRMHQGDAPPSVVLFGPDPPQLSAASETATDATDAGSAQSDSNVVAAVSPHPPGARWQAAGNGDLRLKIPAGNDPLTFTLLIAGVEAAARAEKLFASLEPSESAIDLTALTHGGPPRWPTRITTEPLLGTDDGPFAVDVLRRPASNPWLCRVRPTGFDFLPDGNRMAVCTWDGDVWMVEGIEAPQDGLTWQRIASGLFQPLGVKLVEGQIYVSCRDQIVILHDLDGDGETDFYENFNNDHQVTEHFHEFAMGLQTDADGNFYYAKSARHARTALVPHHGTLLRVSPDGLRTDIVATGFRAANGVCVNPDGTFIVTDQEGHWNPKNRINWVREGGFYGNIWGYHDVTDTSDEAMEQPVCWITNSFDRSPAELLWVDSDRWGPLEGALLNFSYGYGKVYIVPHEEIEGQMQGGMCELPIPQFPTGVIRGRFHPTDGQLYLCGMFAWSGTQQQPGGLYRIRFTGKPAHLPIELNASRKGMAIRFSGKLDRQAAGNPENYAVRTWSLKRTAQYGSDHYDEKTLEIAAATVSDDGRAVLLELPEVKPTWCMEIRYFIKAADGKPIDGVIHNTIHNLAE